MLQLLRIDAVLDRYSHGRTSTYTQVKEGLFPKPVKLGTRSVAWPADEVDAVINARIAGKTDDQIRDLVKALHAKRKSA